jgi:hypothetical protein
MPPALLVKFGPEAFWQPRRIALFRHVAPRTGRAGTTADAGMLAFDRDGSHTPPSAVLAQSAFHDGSSIGSISSELVLRTLPTLLSTGQILNHSSGHGRSRASKALWNESGTAGKPFIRRGF